MVFLYIDLIFKQFVLVINKQNSQKEAEMKTSETVLEFLFSLRPALPMSRERACTPTSNSELRRWLRDQAVILNGKRVGANELVDFPVVSLVFFPKSARHRCTLF